MLLPRCTNNISALLSICGASSTRRNLSCRASKILSSLDISSSKEIPGVYDGEWKGSGDIFESVCPTTGEILARVQSVSLQTSAPSPRSGVRKVKRLLNVHRHHHKSCMVLWIDAGRHFIYLGLFLHLGEEKS